MNEQDDLKLAVKELRRQFEALRRRIGDEAIEDVMASSELAREFADYMEKSARGELSPESEEDELLHFSEEVERMAQEFDNPIALTQLRAENEARTKQLSHIAGLLAYDAMRAAGEGISEEEWINEVQRGYEGDQTTSLACHEAIVRLRKNAPWAWPRL